MSSKLPAAAVGAWLLVAVYYFYQYALRSAPSVMMPQLTEAFGVNALGVSAIVGMFYYGYSPFSLVAGAAIDRFGAQADRPDWRGAGRRRRAAVRHRQRGRRQRRTIPARRRRRVRAGRRRLSRHQELSRLPGRVVHRRHADVRHGGRIGGAVSGRPDHQGRTALGPILDLRRRGRAGDQRLPADLPAERGASRRQPADWPACFDRSRRCL